MGEQKLQLLAILIFGTRSGKGSSARLVRFTPNSHSIGGWVGPIAGVNALEKSWFLGLRAHGCVTTTSYLISWSTLTLICRSFTQPNEIQVVIDASRQVSVTRPNATNAEYSCTSMTSHKNARQNLLKTCQSSNFFLNNTTSSNFIREETRCRWNLGNACHRTVQGILPSHVL